MSQAMRQRSIDKMRANLPIPSPNGPVLLSCQSETINRFDYEGVAANAITQLSTRVNFLHILRHLGLMFPKPYKEITKEDYVKYFNQKVATNTKRGRVRVIKRFNRWLWDLPERTYPECISWIGKPSKPVSHITAADLLTEEDILALYKVADVQSRARMGVLFDTAGRNYEVFNLEKRDVQKTSYGFKITLKCREGSITKGGGSFGNRTVPMVTSHKYLTAWLNEHPTWETSFNPPLWVNPFTGEELEDEGAFRKKLKRISKKAKVTKNVHPHIFRHTKLTDCARMRMPESAMRWFAGWSPTSNMPAVYVHLSGVQMEGEALRSAGVEIPEERPMFDERNIICPLCGIENELHAVYCVTCSSLLDGEKFVREETKKMADLLTANEGMLEQLVNLLKQPHA